MTDMLLQLSQNPLARKIVSGAGLPLPLPESLARPSGALPERFLEGKNVALAGNGEMLAILGQTVVRAGATPFVLDQEVSSAFAEASEAYGRAPQQLQGGESEARTKLNGMVFDATAVASAADLKTLYDFFHPYIRSVAKSGRVVIVGRPADQAKTVREASARAALEGFTRSVAKEVGGKGATANLVIVDEGAEGRASAVVRFFLSSASAFVSAQPLRVSKTSKRSEEKDPWTRPLEGKVALVTGAARGIGAATAAALAAEGAHVVCLDRPEDDEPLSKTARAVGGSVLAANVMDPTAPDTIAAELTRRHGGVDIVVHNAGVTRDKTLGRMSESQWDMVLQINLEAIAAINDALLKGALRDGGRIINLSSVAGIAGNMGQTNYGASKAGVIGLTRFMSAELAKRGITANAIAPGFIETRMTAAIPVVIREAGRRLSALGQGGQPEDVARAITFLATPGAAGVTGQVLRVCGGALIGA